MNTKEIGFFLVLAGLAALSMPAGKEAGDWIVFIGLAAVVFGRGLQMISLLQSACAHYERCARGECHGFDKCAACPGEQMLVKRHEPAADLGARWAMQRAMAPLCAIAESEGGHAD